MSRKDVKLIPQKHAGKIKWKVVHDGKEGDAPANYPKVTLQKDSGPQLIIFELSGNHAGITFPEEDSIWVQAGSKPNQKADHPQIPLAVPVDQGKKLIVLDRNDNDPAKVLELYYRLNFVGADPLDPIIENGGGTIHQPGPPPPPPPAGFLGTSVSAVAILPAVALFILGLAIGRVWTRQ